MPGRKVRLPLVACGGSDGSLPRWYAGEIIKRYGRWVSDSFQGYLWESNEDSRDLARKMAAQSSGLMATKGQ